MYKIINSTNPNRSAQSIISKSTNESNNIIVLVRWLLWLIRLKFQKLLMSLSCLKLWGCILGHNSRRRLLLLLVQRYITLCVLSRLPDIVYIQYKKPNLKKITSFDPLSLIIKRTTISTSSLFVLLVKERFSLFNLFKLWSISSIDCENHVGFVEFLVNHFRYTFRVELNL